MRKRKNWALEAILVVLAISAGVFMSQRPWNAYRGQVANRQTIQNELRQAEDKQEELLRERANGLSRSGREEIARRDGYVGPGEKAVPTN